MRAAPAATSGRPPGPPARPGHRPATGRPPRPAPPARAGGTGAADEAGGEDEEGLDARSTRRSVLLSSAAAWPLLTLPAAGTAATAATPSTSSTSPTHPLPPFTSAGPYAPRRLPPLEHVCAERAPACTAPQCLVTLELWIPAGGGGGRGAAPQPDRGGLRPATPRRAGVAAAPPPLPPHPHPALPTTDGPPFPLAVITGGFLVGRGAYAALAAHLASWGFAALVYDRGGVSAF